MRSYDDGYPPLLAYQSRWNAESAPVAVIEKSRRIGLSWGDASERVLYAGEGRGHVFYMSYNKDMTETYINDCAEWASYYKLKASAVEETLISSEREQISRFRISRN